MGDRTFFYSDCPNCKAEIEYYDAPSSCMFVGVCDTCGWSDPRHYHYTETSISLCNKIHEKVM